MSPSQHILVCTEDSVLAKKIRFLLARDDCEVEILSAPKKLEGRLLGGGISLLIVLNSAGSEDAVELLTRLAPHHALPNTIVLGARAPKHLHFVRAVDDPSDTQAIYRLASELLDDVDISIMESAGLGAASGEDRDFAHRTQRTSTDFKETNSSERVDMNELQDLDFPSEDDLVARLEARVADKPSRLAAEEQEESEEDITVFDVASYHAAAGAGDNIGLAGDLEPRAFAKVLYQCWTMEARGALLITEPHEVLTVYFEGGSPIHVDSNIRGDMLGRNLVEREVIDEEKYAEAAKFAIERGSSIGQATVELGYFSKEALGRELGEDAFERIVKRFATRGGSFEFKPDWPIPTDERPYRIPVGRILAEGLRKFCPDEGLADIVGTIEKTYFRLRSDIDELAKRFPFTETDLEFLEYSGRAYNVADAAKLTGLDTRESRVLLALLLTCEEVDPFTPGVAEFEARIAEEHLRQEEIERRVSAAPAPAPIAPPVITPPPPPVAPAKPNPFAALTKEVRDSAPPPTSESPALERSFDRSFPPDPDSFPPTLAETPAMREPPPPPPPPIRREPPPPPPVKAPPPPPPAPPVPVEARASIPPMPEPPSDAPGRIPRPVVFSPPLPRNPDGSPQETPERTKSREHFQKGVGLLGQGSFDEAEEAFRDAIALCADEHVYLIGLARALYYNPSYTGQGKVPVLRSIVDRAINLAPGDQRVQTLQDWISYAEQRQAAR